ncbi:MAG: hypothetical protein CM15mP74_13960 [Halieaceae bacterium]|nr:MAG: hypothetical protein CM15mP74_13960 [Halieaceae bacterium]
MQHLGGLESIYAQLDAVAELPIRGAKSHASKLEGAKADADLSYELATIKTDCDLGLAKGDLDSSPSDQEAMIALFRELEFKTWLDTLLQGTDGAQLPAAGQQAEGSYRVPSLDRRASRSR